MANDCTTFIAKHLITVVIAVAFVILLIPPAPDGPGQVDISKRPGIYGSETTANNLSDNILVWTQISDVHVQSEYDGVKTTYFRRFLDNEIPIIDPEAVFVTGDLVEAEGPNHTAATIPEQWTVYHNLTAHRTYKKLFLDVIGNHDVYGAVDFSYPENNSVSGKNIGKSMRKVTIGGINTPEYHLLLTKTKISTTFALSPFGDFDNETIWELKEAVAQEAAAGRPAVVLAHHPLGFCSAGFGAADPANWLGITDNSSGYTYHLSGHVHAVRYSRNHRMLELTAGHLMDGHFRILVYDNYLLSFTDVKVGQHPYMVLTYPKSARFLVDAEPNSIMVGANQIRVAAFSDAPMKSISVSIDDKLVCSNMVRVGNGPLYKCSWDSSKLAEGIHDIVIIGEDEIGQVSNITDVISLSGHYPEVTFWQYRMPPVRIFWLMVLCMVACGLLLILPKIQYQIQSRWDEATKTKVGATSYANEMVGPVAVSWIARIAVGHSTVNQFFEQEVLAPVQKLVVLATLQFQTICVKFWTTPTTVWLIEMAFWVYGIVCPVIVSIHGDDSMAAYPFYAKITDVAFVDEITPIVMSIYHLMVLLPICAFIAHCSFLYSSRVPSGPAPVRAIQPPKLSLWTAFLLVVSVLGAAAVLTVTYLMHGGSVILTSPICYLSAAIAIFAIVMFIMSVAAPHEVNRYFDHADVHFQQLVTLPN